MSQARSQKNDGKRSRLPAQSSQPEDARPATANRASIPVAETRYDPTREEIEERAYQCWYDRGCPDGSPEVDWSRAERELRSERQSQPDSAGSFTFPP
jgi:hypothetical protein